LLVSAALGGLYAAAASGATTLGSVFTSTESRAHARSVEFSIEANRASSEHDADRASCTRLAGEMRKACYAAAKFRNARGL